MYNRLPGKHEVNKSNTKQNALRDVPKALVFITIMVNQELSIEGLNEK